MKEKVLDLFDRGNYKWGTQSVTHLVYPRRCPICEGILAPKDKYVHNDCRSQLVFIKQPRCMRCGKAIEHQEQEFCFDCSNRSFHYIKGFPCIKYDKRMSKSISSFKYKGKKEYADFYIDELLSEYEELFCDIAFDVLLPIPIHVSKYKERGFNQAELIADGIAQRIHVPVEPKLLIRNRKTLPQKELNDKERLKNLEQAFELNPDLTLENYQRVLLVDDIYTTGSTIEACARLLTDAGIKEIFYTSICIGQGY